MLRKGRLVDEYEPIARSTDRRAGRGCVRAPQREPLHLLRQIEFSPTLGLDDPHRAIVRLHQEIWNVVGQVATSGHVVELETDGRVVLGERRNACGLVEEGGEFEFEAIVARFADNLGEERSLRNKERALFRAERTRLAQLDPVLDQRRAGRRGGCW